MGSDKSSVAMRFAHDLRELHQRAGRPSYSNLGRVSRHRLRRATMSDILNGNRVNLPEWRFVAMFVEACHGAAAESGLDTRDLGSLADWKQHWDSASNGVIDARFPSGGQPIPIGQDPGPGIAGRGATDDARGPSIWGPVPPRLTDFVGRQTWLADLHGLLVGGKASPVALQGLFGVGKTQLATEYAYRYASFYDLVWWLPCDDPGSAQRAMTELRARLGLPDAAPEAADGGYGELFDRLRQGTPPPRWLLVFDDADEPDEIRHLLPLMGGHVLITTRNSSWEATGEMLELDAFTRQESIEFLHRRMPRCNPVDAHRIAEAVGDLPLFLEHAAQTRLGTGEYLARLGSNPLELLDSQPCDYPASVAGQWRRSLDWLRGQTPDALDLLSCLCFLGGAPIPREALERASYLQGASIHALLQDPIRRNRAIMMLRRAGLLRVDADLRTLTVHQGARYIVREMVTRAGTNAAHRSRRDAQLLLAAADPLNPEDPLNWRGYEQLREHAAEADLEGCSDEAARRLVINLVRFLNASGDPRGALSLADGALSRWAGEPAPGELTQATAAYNGCLAMRQARVDALFACGHHSQASQFQQDTLDLMRSTPGDWGDEVVLLGALSGARLRVLGRFAQALQADLESRDKHEARFGRDHPYCFAAATAVILDLALTGQFAGAVREARRVHDACHAFHNDDAYPAVLFQRNVLARCLWLNGQRDQATDMMADVHAGYQALGDAGVLDQRHLWRLAHETDFAVIRRDSGAKGPDLAVLEGDMQEVRRRSWRTLGPDHPQTLAATVVLASILRRLPHRQGEAVRLLADAERRYRKALQDHAFSHACKGYLAVVRRQAAIGDPQETAEGSAADLEGVIARLTDLVGDDHPLTLDARSALAAVRSADGDPARVADFTPLPL